MRFFRDMTIKGKIVSVVLLLVGLEVAISATGIFFISEVNKRFTEVVNIDGEKRKLAMQIEIALLQIHRAQKSLILSDSEDLIQSARVAKAFSVADLQTNLTGLQELLEPDERELIRQFRKDWDTFYKVDQEIEKLVLQAYKKMLPTTEGGFMPSSLRVLNAEAMALSASQGQSSYDMAIGVMNEIVKKMDASVYAHLAESRRYFGLLLQAMLLLVAVGVIAGLVAGFKTARSIAHNLGAMVRVTDAIAGGVLDTQVLVASNDETGRLAGSVKRMQAGLVRAAKETSERDWVKTGVARISTTIRGKVDIGELCRQAIAETATYLQAPVGVLFLANGDPQTPVLEAVAGYAYSRPDPDPDGSVGPFKAGEGLVGQVALTHRTMTITDIPKDYLKICSGLGQSQPGCIIVAPLLFENRLAGVIEMGLLKPLSDLQLEYLEQVLPAVAVTIETVRSRQHLSEALKRAQDLTAELQQQQDELKAINAELEEQTLRLSESQDKLRSQQEEIEAVNAELEERNHYLARQKEATDRANQELEQSRLELEERAVQLATASRFKSEFLANMSHELRTPLNSILLLARMLGENKEGNLNSEQVRSAQIINSSGNDLLNLINDVLDLAKVESGRMEINVERVSVRDLADSLDQQFQALAQDKRIRLDVQTGVDCPESFKTDCKRLEQILRNLVSNAIKFTDTGEVAVRIERPPQGAALPPGLKPAATIAFTVQDTGIGISPDQHATIFEAFRQLDSGAARKFGGTGLGLSISRDLAQLLGGDIQLQSQPGQGSLFTLLLPEDHSRAVAPEPRTNRAGGNGGGPHLRTAKGQAQRHEPVVAERRMPECRFQDDREHLAPGDATILVIEDDPKFAESLLGLCRQKHFKTLVALTGEEGLEMADTHQPKGIVLDIQLPGKNGWTVLDELKSNSRTRHIPVHIISVEETGIRALEKGAVGFLSKPVCREDLEAVLTKLSDVYDRPMKDLLVVEDDPHLRGSIIKLIGNGDVACDQAATAAQALQAVQAKRYDCMILDLGLPDMNGLDMLKKMSEYEDCVLPPVIVYTGRDLSREEEGELRYYSESIIVKGVRSEERLFDETSLFLHRMVDKMPAHKRRIITDLYEVDTMFQDKRILVVDDDMRNVFALSGLLEEKGMQVLKAENGRKALTILETRADVDLVLMDIMMPVMDGYETIRQIRSREDWRALPVIALTAKAMKSDRERCIAVGANDYLVKPLDTGRLFSILRIWLYR